jgi:asparagine synthase (glutamine-hydrolysing)
MCGIAGFFTTDGSHCQHGEMTAIATDMADAMIHRGPDGSGVWVDETTGLALAHRRLAVIDLSATGSQPMQSRNGRFVIVYNGEVYNHRELRRELSDLGETFRGHSDTEVILAGCEAWGVEKTIRRCVGMFAIALWDAHNKELYLIKDRMGEKPLYYGWQGSTFLFASELKAMRRYPDFSGEIDRDSLALYFRYRYIPAPYSIYKDIHKLEPGMILRISPCVAVGGDMCRNGRKQAFWSLKTVAEEAESKAYDAKPADAVNALEALLIQSIKGQMIADVPLGAFLSGGVDSSTIVALMQKLSPAPVNTFSIGFHEENWNEAVHAKRIAEHLGCNHTELYVTAQQVRDVIPAIPRLYDEPFADSSQIPTYLVSRLARSRVAVSLSGDAGDELFYGYQAYRLLFRRWRFARRIGITSASARSAVLKLVQLVLNASQKQLAVADSILSPGACSDLHRSMVSVSHDPCRLVLGSKEPPCLLTRKELHPKISSPQNTIMALDALSYLPDDGLVKVDRAAMACSLETRVPLLDYRIVEFAFGLPLSIKFREGMTKWPLRQILYKYVPRSLVERPKRGFSMPLKTWLRGDLKEWTYDLLRHDGIARDGILNPGLVARYLSEHMNGQHDHSEVLWSLLMFQCWLHNA